MQRVLKSRLPGGVVAQWVRATVHWATLPRIPGFDYGYDLPGTAYFEGFLIPHIKGTVSQAGLRSRFFARSRSRYQAGQLRLRLRPKLVGVVQKYENYHENTKYTKQDANM